jgi:hypothetical protein
MKKRAARLLQTPRTNAQRHLLATQSSERPGAEVKGERRKDQKRRIRFLMKTREKGHSASGQFPAPLRVHYAPATRVAPAFVLQRFRADCFHPHSLPANPPAGYVASGWSLTF